jgi:glycogen synthase
VNIWLLPSAFHPHKGGVEEMTLQLARQLQARRHDVLVITNQHPTTLAPAEIVEGVRVMRLKFVSPRTALLPAARFPFAFAKAVAALLRQAPKPDIVHVHCASTQLAAAVAFSAVRHAPLILTTHGEIAVDANLLYEHSTYARLVFRIAGRTANELTACSTWTAANAAKLAPEFRHATIIENGIDTAQWRLTAPSDAAVVGAWGRHVPQKGFDLLLDAWPRVREVLPSARLLLGGAGPESPALKARKLDGVDFLGPLDRLGVQALIAQSRVVVVPSRIEPFGIVALEAMAVGRPVVWSTFGGLREATGGLGWPADPSNAPELAHAILEAIDSEPRPEFYRQHTTNYAWSDITNKYLALYQRVSAERGSRSCSVTAAQGPDTPKDSAL